MAKKLELTGQRFSRLTVISFSDVTNQATYWICKCDCGNITRVAGTHLKTGHTTSCGCFYKETRKGKLTHGQKNSTEYNSWNQMKGRCYNPNLKEYKHYGGRGITVCDRWINSFENFFADMGKKPTPKHTLDRYPNNESGNYEPSNCRWATWEQQNRNKRWNHWLEANGEKMIITDWQNKLKIDRHTILKRLKTQTFQEIVDEVLI